MKEYSPEGRHVLAELSGCTFPDNQTLVTMMEFSAREGGATVLSSHFHEFEPQGVSITVILAESHFNAHIYPEHRLAVVDCFTCGKVADPEAVVKHFGKYVEARVLHYREVSRGLNITYRNGVGWDTFVSECDCNEYV